MDHEFVESWIKSCLKDCCNIKRSMVREYVELCNVQNSINGVLTMEEKENICRTKSNSVRMMWRRYCEKARSYDGVLSQMDDCVALGTLPELMEKVECSEIVPVTLTFRHDRMGYLGLDAGSFAPSGIGCLIVDEFCKWLDSSLYRAQAIVKGQEYDLRSALPYMLTTPDVTAKIIIWALRLRIPVATYKYQAPRAKRAGSWIEPFVGPDSIQWKVLDVCYRYMTEGKTLLDLNASNAVNIDLYYPPARGLGLQYGFGVEVSDLEIMWCIAGRNKLYRNSVATKGGYYRMSVSTAALTAENRRAFVEDLKRVVGDLPAGKERVNVRGMQRVDISVPYDSEQALKSIEDRENWFM